MSRGVLNKSGLVTEGVAAILSRAMEVSLMLPVSTMLISAVLIEPEAEVALRDGLVLHHAHVWAARCVRSPGLGYHFSLFV